MGSHSIAILPVTELRTECSLIPDICSKSSGKTRQKNARCLYSSGEPGVARAARVAKGHITPVGKP